MSLEQQHSDVTSKLYKGCFVIHKSRREVSTLAIKQAHEQSNSVIKDDRGAVILEDPEALRRWMVAGPKLSCLIAGYEAVAVKDAAISSKHHEQALGV